MVSTKRSPLPRFLSLAMVFTLLILSSACDIVGGTQVTEEDKEQAINVVKWNLYYAQVEDLAGYMRTIHDDSPARADTLSVMQMIFNEFNLSYQIVTYQILSISKDSADVRVVLDTRKVSGELPFRDNRLTTVHTLKKSEDGKWKIYYSEMEDVQYLN